MRCSLRQILTDAVAQNASDLHCLVGNPITIRRHGELTDLYPESLTDEDTLALVDEIATDEQKRQLRQRRVLQRAQHHQLAGRYEDLLARKSNVQSRLNRGQGREQPNHPCYRDDHDVGS